MGNHCIDCDYCGRDTRGLSGVRGCDTQAQALDCSNFAQVVGPEEVARRRAAEAMGRSEPALVRDQRLVPTGNDPSADGLVDSIARVAHGLTEEDCDRLGSERVALEQVLDADLTDADRPDRRQDPTDPEAHLDRVLELYRQTYDLRHAVLEVRGDPPEACRDAAHRGAMAAVVAALT